jgi:hypothetical protein
MKIRPVGAELFHANGQTDMKKVIVAFRNLANAPENNCYKQTFTVNNWFSSRTGFGHLQMAALHCPSLPFKLARAFPARRKQ